VKWRTIARRALSIVLPALLLLVSGCGGCRDGSTDSGSLDTDAGAADRYREDLFDYAVSNLNRLEEFSPGNVFQNIFERIEQTRRLEVSSGHLKDALMMTCPEPEILPEIIDRLNRWVQSQEPPADWQRDGMVDELPTPLEELPVMKELARLEYSPYDGFALREAVWLRNVAAWARGDSLDDVGRAKSLFDWTVRNIQLERETGRRLPLLPWEALLFGRGTAAERAWVFILLCRQQHLDAALLVRADQVDSMAAPWRSWGLVAVRSGGDFYLFDPALGLPVPAPDAVKLDKTGQLDVQPATLAQVVADASLLHRLDVDQAGRRADLGPVVALLEASPAYLSSRMKLIESKLPAENKMVLATSPTLQAERWEASGQAADVRLWKLPFESMHYRSQLTPEIIPGIRQRLLELVPFYGFSNAPLRKARMLHLAGKFTGPEGAYRYYLDARPSNRQLEEAARKRELAYYQEIRRANPGLPEDRAQWIVRERARAEMGAWRQAKQHASYWLGLSVFEECLRTAPLRAETDYTPAIEWFAQRTLEASPDGPWTHGATYNLARAYEASKQYDRAIELYESDPTAPDHHGNLLRARWLKELLGGDAP